MRFSFRSALVIATLCSLSSLVATAQDSRLTAGRPLSHNAPALSVAVLKRDQPRIRQLLDAGADPNEKDSQGMSPWMWAVNYQNNDALIALLDRMPAISVTDADGRRRLAMAASLNNLVAVRALLNKRVPVDSPAVDGATPLLIAASSGYTDVMKALLESGAESNSRDEHGDTPLMAAARSGSLDAAKLLLASHSNPNQRDDDGRSPLHWAARSGRADMVHLLLNAGAVVDVTDTTGRTPLAYAREKGHEGVAEMLKKNGAREAPSLTRRGTLTPRDAIEKALPLLIRGWQSWSEQQTCGACHHRLMIVRVAALAETHGFGAAESLADDQRKFFARSSAAGEPRVREQLSSEESFVASAFGIYGDGSSGDALNLNAMLELGVPTSAALQMRALVLARKQLADGRWPNGLPRVPILSSDFTTTAFAARTIAAYAASTDAAEIHERVERAKRWLMTNTPVTTDDEASRLLGLLWTHADQMAINDAVDLLTHQQNADGSWSQLAGLNGDAYATGMVLVALGTGGGLRPTDSVYRRGVEYLLRTQEADGSWFVPKRAAASNEYFESGFPYGKFQFISYAASCWATMALLYAEPTGPGAGRHEIAANHRHHWLAW